MKRTVFIVVTVALLVLSASVLTAKGIELTKLASGKVLLNGSNVEGAHLYQNPQDANQYVLFVPGFSADNGVLVDLKTRDLFAVPKRYVEESASGAVLNRKVSSLDKMKSAVLKLDRPADWIVVTIQNEGKELEVTFKKP